MHNFVYLAQRRSQEFSCEPNYGGGRAPRPSGCASVYRIRQVGHCAPTFSTRFLEPKRVCPKRHLDRFIRLCRITGVQTDTQSGRITPTMSVAFRAVHAMRANNNCHLLANV